MIGASLIKDERMRQIGVEGWTEDHDLGHNHSEMILAAIAYLVNYVEVNENERAIASWEAKQIWPWEEELFKPEEKVRDRRDLVKAGALIAAEIDRLLNMAKKEAE